MTKKFFNINIFVFFSVLLMYQIPLSTAIWILILSLLYFIYNLQINFCCKKPNISPIFYLSSTFFCIQISRWQKLPSQFHEINKHTQKFFLKTRYIYLSFTFDNCVFDPDVLVEYGHVDFHDWQSLCRNMCKCMDVHLYHAGTSLGLWYSQSKTPFCCKTYLFLFAFPRYYLQKLRYCWFCYKSGFLSQYFNFSDLKFRTDNKVQRKIVNTFVQNLLGKQSILMKYFPL